MGQIWERIVMDVYHFEPESTKTRKLAEANSEAAKHYWRTVSDNRSSSRQQRVRPVAADFFDDYPQHSDREIDHTLSTRAGSGQQIPNQDTSIVDAGQVLANEEQAYRGKSEKPQTFPSQLSVCGGTTRYAKDGTAFSSAPPSGLGYRFHKDFGPVASVDANGIIVDKTNHSLSF